MTEASLYILISRVTNTHVNLVSLVLHLVIVYEFMAFTSYLFVLVWGFLMCFSYGDVENYVVLLVKIRL